jgi:hypothetical protein
MALFFEKRGAGCGASCRELCSGLCSELFSGLRSGYAAIDDLYADLRSWQRQLCRSSYSYLRGSLGSALEKSRSIGNSFPTEPFSGANSVSKHLRQCPRVFPAFQHNSLARAQTGAR